MMTRMSRVLMLTVRRSDKKQIYTENLKTFSCDHETTQQFIKLPHPPTLRSLYPELIIKLHEFICWMYEHKFLFRFVLLNIQQPLTNFTHSTQPQILQSPTRG